MSFLLFWHFPRIFVLQFTLAKGARQKSAKDELRNKTEHKICSLKVKRKEQSAQPKPIRMPAIKTLFVRASTASAEQI